MDVCSKNRRRSTDLLGHGPDANVIGRNLYNRRQEEIQVHVATKRWSAEWYSIVNHGVNKPKKAKKVMVAQLMNKAKKYENEWMTVWLINWLTD